MNFLKALVSTVLLSMSSAFGACNIVMPYGPGGPADIWAHSAQKLNPDIKLIQYRPGAYGSMSMNFMREAPEYMMWSGPIMYSAQNPMKPAVEMLDMLLIYGQMGVTSKDVTFQDLLTKPVNIAVVNLGGAQHLVALKLQAINPKIVIVPLTSVGQGLQLLLAKDIDAFLTPSTSGKPLVDQYGFRQLFEMKAGQTVLKKDGVTLMNYGMLGVFMHSTATVEQKANAKACLTKLNADPKWEEELAKVYAAPFAGGADAKKAHLQAFIDELAKSGF